MTHPLVIHRYPHGPRCWLFGQRVHHGAAGCLLLLMALRSDRARSLAAVGLMLCLHDRADVRVWFRRAGLDSLADVL